MAVIKKVVAMSGEEYDRLRQKAAAYDALLAAQAAQEGEGTGTEVTETTTEGGGDAGGTADTPGEGAL